MLVPFLGMLSVPVYAGHIDHDRHAKSEHRLDPYHATSRHGDRHKKLTGKEAKLIRQQYKYIAKLKRLFKKDGRLSRDERRMLKRKASQVRKMAHRLKHKKHQHRSHAGHALSDYRKAGKGRHASSARFNDKDKISLRLNYRDHF